MSGSGLGTRLVGLGGLGGGGGWGGGGAYLHRGVEHSLEASVVNLWDSGDGLHQQSPHLWIGRDFPRLDVLNVLHDLCQTSIDRIGSSVGGRRKGEEFDITG